MKNWKYTKVPDGSWGWSNAGLIEDGGQTLLVREVPALPIKILQ
jgi:hypothetical protein